MKTIEFASPVSVGPEGAVKVEIAPLMFVKFTELARKAASARRGNQKFEVLMQRERIKEQCTFITAGNKRLKITDEQLITLAAAPARQIVAELPSDEGQPGKLLSSADADGVSAAIHYALGTPIKAQGDKEIAEIEFLAKTFGDLETVLSGDSDIYQTVDLIQTVAKPVGGTLLSLPSWALDQITMADGIFIMNNVLPRFLK